MRRLDVLLLAVLAARWSSSRRSGVQAEARGCRAGQGDGAAVLDPGAHAQRALRDRTLSGRSPCGEAEEEGAGGRAAGPAAVHVPADEHDGKVFFTEGGLNYVCSGTAL